MLDVALDNSAFLAKIPLIGDQLKDAASFVKDLRDRVSKTQGFFLSTAANDELKFTIDATIPNFVAKGSLGFFQVDATDDPAAPSFPRLSLLAC